MKLSNLLYVVVLLIVSLNLMITLSIVYKKEKNTKDDSVEALSTVSNQIPDLFSNREKEIALAVLEGKTNSEIAQEKCISPTTVKKHIYNLFQKTNTRNRVEFINYLRDVEHRNLN